MNDPAAASVAAAAGASPVLADASRERLEARASHSLGSLQKLRPVLAFLRPYRLQAAAASVALVCTAAITLSLGQGLRLLVDEGLGSGSGARLDATMLLFLGLMLLLGIGTFARYYLVSWIGEKVSADLRLAVFHHLLDMHPGFFESNSVGEIQSRITTDTTLLQTVVGSSVSIALRNLLLLVGGVLWLLFTNAKLTSIALLSVPAVLVPILVLGRRVRRLSRNSQDRIADLGSYVGETLHGIKIVQAFNHQEQDRERFTRHVGQAFLAAASMIRQRAWLTTIVILLVMGAVGAMLWVGGHDVLQGRISPGELVAFLFYAIMVVGAVGALSDVLGDLQRAAGAVERLLELLRLRPAVVAPAQPRHLPRDGKGGLQIRQLSFYYPSRPGLMVLDQLQLEVPGGMRLALVGRSGAGKSTLFDLLLRFQLPVAGAIFLDGVDIASLDPRELRAHLALVPQDAVLFRGSVAENIRYGNPEATDRQLREAAQAAYAHEFIAQLPAGYDCELGERGVRLSGGQRQRIAIARALLRNPRVLLLDEATSALDADSEHEVRKALGQLMQGRTSLVIAHRLATVQDADRIAVLDSGRLEALGSHQELLESSPLYARWVELQASQTSRAGKEKAPSAAAVGG